MLRSRQPSVSTYLPPGKPRETRRVPYEHHGPCNCPYKEIGDVEKVESGGVFPVDRRVCGVPFFNELVGMVECVRMSKHQRDRKVVAYM